MVIGIPFSSYLHTLFPFDFDSIRLFSIGMLQDDSWAFFISQDDVGSFFFFLVNKRWVFEWIGNGFA